MRMITHLHVLLLAALVAVSSTAFAATTSELLQQGLYAEEVEGNLDAAIKAYAQVVESPSAPANHVAQALYRQGMCYVKLHNDTAARAVLKKLVTQYANQTEVVEKAKPLLDDLMDFDPASLMPPNTLVYVELGCPGKQVETLLNTLRGTPYENPLATVGGARQRNDGGEKSPADLVGALLNPSMTAEFKKIRSSAIGITGVAKQNPPAIAILYPGKSDALRGIILAALGAAGKPGDTVEGMQTVLIQPPNQQPMAVAYDDRVIIAANPASQLEWCVKQYRGLTSEPTLATSNESFARISKAQRHNHTLTVWADVDEIYGQLHTLFPDEKLPPQLVAANVFADFPNMDALFLSDSIGSNSLASHLEFQFKDGHHCLAYDLVRTPNIRKAALEAVPADAIALASFSLSPAAVAQVDTIRTKVQNLTGLDMDRELFTNIEQVVLFAMPVEKTPASSRQEEFLPGRLGLALTSRNPEQTHQAITTLLSSAETVSAGGRNTGTDGFKIGNSGGHDIICHLEQVNSTTILSLDRAVLNASVDSIRNQRSVLASGPFHAALEELPPIASKLILVNVGGAIRALAPFAKLGGLSEDQAEQLNVDVEKLASATRDTTLELRTDEQTGNFAVNSRMTGLPQLNEVVGPIAEIVRIAKAAGAKASAESLRMETPVTIFPATKPPVIDGDEDDVWAPAQEAKLEHESKSFGSGETPSPISSPDDLAAAFRALWDEENLYLLVDVTDDSLISDTDPIHKVTLPSGSQSIPWWYDDSIEVYLDADNAKTPEYGPHDAQFRFNWGPEPTLRVYRQNVEVPFEGVQYAMVKTDKGYRLEASFPWKAFNVKPSAGSTIGLDVHVNDDDDGGPRDSKIAWHDQSDNAWQSPQTFGNGELGGLVAWWKFDETDGSIAKDSSGNGHDGELVGMPKWTGGKVGGALDFNGSRSFVEIPDSDALKVGGQITLAAWVKLRAVPTDWMAIITKGDSSWRLSTVERQQRFHFSVGDWAKDPANGATQIHSGEWHHVTAVFNGSTLQLYVDGKLDATQPWTDGMGRNSAKVLIGENVEQPNRCFDGLLDDVRVYSYALPESEIRALAAAQ